MKTGRLHIRVDKKLEEAVREYAQRHDTTVTRIVEKHLRYLLDVDRVAAGFRKGKEEISRHALPKED